MPIRRDPQAGGGVQIERRDEAGDPRPVVTAFLRDLAACDYSPHTVTSYAHDRQHRWRCLMAHGLTWQTFQSSPALDWLTSLRAFSSPHPVQRLGLSLATTPRGQPARPLAPKTIKRSLAAVSSCYEDTMVAGV